MGSPKRTKAERERDREYIARLYLQRKTFREIAGVFNDEQDERGYTLSYVQIYNDFKAVEKQWIDDSKEHIDKIKARELARLDEIEREAFNAWKLSIGVNVTKKGKQKTSLTGVDSTVEKIERELNGDPRYLQIILQCQDRRAKLLGLDSPQKLDHTTDGKPLESSKNPVAVLLEKLPTDKLRELKELSGWVTEAEETKKD